MRHPPYQMFVLSFADRQTQIDAPMNGIFAIHRDWKTLLKVKLCPLTSIEQIPFLGGCM